MATPDAAACNLQSSGWATAPAVSPNVLSPHSRGYMIEDVWPPLFWGPERLAEIQRKIAQLPWAQALYANLLKEADAVAETAPRLPIEPIGWRHDYYSPATAEHLVFDPDQPLHIDPSTQETWEGETFHKAWTLLVHERTYRLMRSMACLYRLSGCERYGAWAVQALECAVRMFSRDDFRNPKQHNALYYQTLYDAQVLALIANTCAWLQGTAVYTPELHSAIAQTVFERSMPYQISFMEKRGAHNMTCYVDAALAFAGLVLKRTDWLDLAVNHPTGGFLAMLRHGLAREAAGESDGFWGEGTMFYHYYSVCPLLSLYALLQSPAWPRDTVAATADAQTRRAIARMLLAPVEMADQQLRLPTFGDLGAPRHVKLPLYRHLYEMGAGVLENAAVHAALGAIAATGATRCGLTALAFGPDNVTPTAHSPASIYLPATGVAILRKQGTQAYLKCSMSPGGHDHQDKLSFGLSAHGQLVVADLGTAGYSVRDLHAYYRSAVSHSTIVVDDDEKQQLKQAELQASLETGQAMAKLLFAPDGPQVQRQLKLSPPYLYIQDQCIADEPHVYTWLVHPYGAAAVCQAGEPAAVDVPPLPTEGAWAQLTNRRTFAASGPICVDWQVADGLSLRVWVLVSAPCSVTLAHSPGNPRSDARTTLAIRFQGTRVAVQAALEVYTVAPSMVQFPQGAFAELNGA